jgi:hypothetical protein
MDASTGKSRGHSSVVQMELHLGRQVLRIAQLGPDFFVLHQPCEHPPADAEIRMRIDDSESRWPVRLVDGISPERRKAKLGAPAVLLENGSSHRE